MTILKTTSPRQNPPINFKLSSQLCSCPLTQAHRAAGALKQTEDSQCLLLN